MLLPKTSKKNTPLLLYLLLCINLVFGLAAVPQSNKNESLNQMYNLFFPVLPNKISDGNTLINSKIVLRNLSAQAVDITFTFYPQQAGSAPIQVPDMLNPNSSRIYSLDQVPSIPSAGYFSVVISASQPVEGIAKIVNETGDQLASYTAQNFGSTELVFGPFFDYSSLFLMNVSPSTAQASISYLSDGGMPPLIFPTGTIPSGGFQRFDRPPEVPAGSYWVKVTSDQPLVGVVKNFLLPPLDFELQAPLGPAATTVYLPRVLKTFDDGGGARSSLLQIVNAGNLIANVDLSLKNETGIITRAVTVQPSSKINLYLAGDAALPENNVWAVTATSDQPIYLGELTGNDSASPAMSFAAYPGSILAWGPTFTVSLPYLQRSAKDFSILNVQNQSGTQAAVTIHYYNGGDTAIHTQTLNISPSSLVRINQAAIPELGTNYAGNAIISSDQPIGVLAELFTTICYPPKNVQLSRTPAGDLYSWNNVQFSVTASGTAPLHYVWSLDAATVGSDANSYSQVFAGTGQHTLGVEVSNACGQASNSMALNFKPSVPVLTSLEPTSHLVNGSPLVLTLNGSGFTPESVVRWNGVDQVTQYFTRSLLRTTINTTAITQDQVVGVSVFNPGQGEGESISAAFWLYVPKDSPVKPLLECVTENNTADFSAKFSYQNVGANPVTIPLGDNNRFLSAPAARGQPETFLVGKPANPFTVNFDGTDLTWYLNGATVTASGASPRCAKPAPDPFSLTKVSPDHGKFGLPNDINIHGNGLLSTTQVYLASSCPIPLVEIPADAIQMNGSFMNDLHIRAVVPAGQAEGTYAILAGNLDGGITCLPDAYKILPDTHDDLYATEIDLWSSPTVLRANSQANLGLVLHRSGGDAPISNVVIHFYLGERGVGGKFIGEGQVDSIEKNNSKASSTVAWAIPEIAGVYSIYAYIDPENYLANDLDKSNNIVTRQLTIEPAAQDVTAPEVVSVTSIDGAVVKQSAVNLQIITRDPGQNSVSGIRSIYLIEYEYNQAAGEWVQVQSSNWVSIHQLTYSYQWKLVETPGLHFIKVWAADKAGNVSEEPGSVVVNYQPGSGKLAKGLIHLYRMNLTKGQNIQVDLYSVTGDADLYIWKSDNITKVFSLLEGSLDAITYAVEESGIYQIEIYGFTACEYELTVTFLPVTPDNSMRSQSMIEWSAAQESPRGSMKTELAEPMIKVSNEPIGKTALPNPEPRYSQYIPVLISAQAGR